MGNIEFGLIDRGLEDILKHIPRCARPCPKKYYFKFLTMIFPFSERRAGREIWKDQDCLAEECTTETMNGGVLQKMAMLKEGTYVHMVPMIAGIIACSCFEHWVLTLISEFRFSEACSDPTSSVVRSFSPRRVRRTVELSQSCELRWKEITRRRVWLMSWRAVQKSHTSAFPGSSLSWSLGVLQGSAWLREFLV